MGNICKASAIMALMGTLLWIGVAHAATDAVTKCQEAKLKAQGKLERCLNKNSIQILGGAPDASAACRTAFTDALSKADATAAKKNATCRFLDDGDGTVSDLNTGLVWEKKDTNCPGPHCYSDTFSWSASGEPNYPPDGTAFTTFLGGLNIGASSLGTMSTAGCFTGHCDWRLPTIEELAPLIDLTEGNCAGGSGACIDPVFGPTEASFYWSTTNQVDPHPSGAWGAFFYNGGVFTADKAADYVRAVRGGL